MPWIAGIDGCPAGWICVYKNIRTGEIRSAVFESAADLFHAELKVDRFMIDIPIGLPNSGDRACDLAARALLGKRRSSVFPAPIRPAMLASSHQQASDITQRIDGKRISVFAWNLFKKIRQVDTELARHTSLQNKVFEVHPELCFRAMNGNRPGDEMPFSKKTPQGRSARQSLIATHFGKESYSEIRRRYTTNQVSHDDLADAFATLWSAERGNAGELVTLPSTPPRDSTGLPMRICY